MAEPDAEPTYYRQRCEACGFVTVTRRAWDISGCCEATATVLSTTQTAAQQRPQTTDETDNTDSTHD